MMAEFSVTAEIAMLSPLSNTFDCSKIRKQDLDLSSLCIPESDNAVAFVLENILTPGECEALIQLSEQTKFSPVSVSYKGKEVVNNDLRSGDRVIIDNEIIVTQLWTRISPFIPLKLKGAQIVGLNERLRFLKYSTEQFFSPHTDGTYVRPYNNLEISLLTIQMYLNEKFDGGETTFLPFSATNASKEFTRVPVKPKIGMALVFSQDLFHEGSRVKNGVKYTVRTDVMYRYGGTHGL